MNPSNNDSGSSPSIPSASDEAALQAIEALEVESNDITDLESPATPKEPAPVINEPLVSANPVSPAPIPITTPLTPPTTQPVATSNPSAPTEEPSTPQSPAAIALSKSLRDDSVPYSSMTFQPFADQNSSSKKPMVIIIVILVLIGLGIGGYFGWQYLQNSNKPAAVTPASTQTTETNQTPVVTTDTDESVTTAVSDMTKALDTIDDSEYNDTTLNDSSLLQ
ncbi:MAG: hypothetical protein WA030_02355 [Candidatus Microsaccharimonas sp.]